MKNPIGKSGLEFFERVRNIKMTSTKEIQEKFGLNN